ncbi:MAG: hypothetical protein WDN72_05940 [Alphaproteobacteria bacterium]
MPKVLIADKLSPQAVAIFKDRGVEADTKTGLSEEELLKIIGDYDGLAIRSATKSRRSCSMRPRSSRSSAAPASASITWTSRRRPRAASSS